MNAPLDPDQLRTRLTQAVEPVEPSPDALVRIRAGVQRRRRLLWTVGSGAGALAVAGAAAAVIGIGSFGQTAAVTRTVQPGYVPTVTTSPASTSAPPSSSSPSAAGNPSVGESVFTAILRSAGSASAGSPAVTSTVAAGSTTPARSTPTRTTSTGSVASPVPDDVDGDGRPDTAEVVFAGTKAHLVLHLASGTIAGPAFRLGPSYGAGVTTLSDVNGDGRAELMVKGIGATGTPYYLFQYLGGALVQVPALAGSPSDPPLFSGGGGVGEGHRFDCVAGHIEQAGYVVESGTISGALSDRRYDVTVERLTLVDGHLHGQPSRQLGLTLQQAQSQLAQHPDGRCGAPL